LRPPPFLFEFAVIFFTFSFCQRIFFILQRTQRHFKNARNHCYRVREHYFFVREHLFLKDAFCNSQLSNYIWPGSVHISSGSNDIWPSRIDNAPRSIVFVRGSNYGAQHGIAALTGAGSESPVARTRDRGGDPAMREPTGSVQQRRDLSGVS